MPPKYFPKNVSSKPIENGFSDTCKDHASEVFHSDDDELLDGRSNKSNDTIENGHDESAEHFIQELGDLRSQENEEAHQKHLQLDIENFISASEASSFDASTDLYDTQKDDECKSSNFDDSKENPHKDLLDCAVSSNELDQLNEPVETFKENSDFEKSKNLARLKEVMNYRDQIKVENEKLQKRIALQMASQNQANKETPRLDHDSDFKSPIGIPVDPLNSHNQAQIESFSDQNKLYENYLALQKEIVKIKEAHDVQHVEFGLVISKLQAKLDQKELKSKTIDERFMSFRKETAKKSSLRPSVHAQIEKLEKATREKDLHVEKMRLRNISLAITLKKLEGLIQAKDELAEGLHMMDFEQLKIENQALNGRLEEQNQEELKLRQKITNTIQVLTHVKEKFQFEISESTMTQRKLDDLDEQINASREELSQLKQMLENTSTKRGILQKNQGSNLIAQLASDFDTRACEIENMKNTLQKLEQEYQAYQIKSA